MTSTQPAKRALAAEYTMKAGFILGLYFLVEYLIRIFTIRHLSYAMFEIPFVTLVVHLVLLGLTVYFLYLCVYPLSIIFRKEGLGAFRAWTYGVQVMFFAGLIEALFVYILNSWILPDNLQLMNQAVIDAFQQSIEQWKQTQTDQALPALMETLQETQKQLNEMPVQTPIQAAVQTLSNDISYGIFLMIPLSFIVRKKKQQ